MCDRDWITVATRDERSAPDLTVQLGGIVEAALIVPVHRREQHHRVEPVPSKTLAGTRDAVQIFDMRKGRPFDGIFRCSLSLRQFVSYGFASDLPPVSVASVSAIRRAQAIAASPRFFPAWLRLRRLASRSIASLRRPSPHAGTTWAFSTPAIATQSRRAGAAPAKMSYGPVSESRAAPSRALSITGCTIQGRLEFQTGGDFGVISKQ